MLRFTVLETNLTIHVWGATMGPAAADAGVTQLVECDLAKVDVAGSNPVSRSILASFRPLPS